MARCTFQMTKRAPSTVSADSKGVRLPTDIVYDAVIIGGGPGGYSAAFRAAQLGLKVALVEVFKLGGVCPYGGCVPYKALEACARTVATVQTADQFGLSVGRPKTSLPAIVDRKDAIVERLAADLRALVNENKVDYFQGLGAIREFGVVTVRDIMAGTEILLQGRNIVLATGSKPRMIPGIAADGGYGFGYLEFSRGAR